MSREENLSTTMAEALAAIRLQGDDGVTTDGCVVSFSPSLDGIELRWFPSLELAELEYNRLAGWTEPRLLSVNDATCYWQ